MSDVPVYSSKWRLFISTGINQPFSPNQAIEGPYRDYVDVKKAALKLSRLMRQKVYIYSFCAVQSVKWGSKKGKKKEGRKS